MVARILTVNCSSNATMMTFIQVKDENLSRHFIYLVDKSGNKMVKLA